jgi:hypothetical protein
MIEQTSAPAILIIALVFMVVMGGSGRGECRCVWLGGAKPGRLAGGGMLPNGEICKKFYLPPHRRLAILSRKPLNKNDLRKIFFLMLRAQFASLAAHFCNLVRYACAKVCLKMGFC